MTLVDARGERCPMPVIRLAKVAAQARPGEQIVDFVRRAGGVDGPRRHSGLEPDARAHARRDPR